MDQQEGEKEKEEGGDIIQMIAFKSTDNNSVNNKIYIDLRRLFYCLLTLKR